LIAKDNTAGVLKLIYHNSYCQKKMKRRKVQKERKGIKRKKKERKKEERTK
jgi:hypothetical protein